jgi:hypothetical protein
MIRTLPTNNLFLGSNTNHRYKRGVLSTKMRALQRTPLTPRIGYLERDLCDRIVI